MPISNNEFSIQEGMPAVLYRFTSAGEKWLFNSSDEPITHNSEVYEPLAIKHNGVKFSGSTDDLQLTITFANGVPFSYVNFTDANVYCQLFHGHINDGDFIQFWHGYVSGRTLDAETQENTLIVEHVRKIFEKTRLTISHTASCQRMLYSRGCGLDIETFYIDVEVVSIEQNVITFSSSSVYDNDWFRAGVLQFGALTRTITKSTATTLETIQIVPGLNVGDHIRIAPGCDHSYETCATKFNNLPNNLSFPLIPVKNIFTEGMR